MVNDNYRYTGDPLTNMERIGDKIVDIYIPLLNKRFNDSRTLLHDVDSRMMSTSQPQTWTRR